MTDQTPETVGEQTGVMQTQFEPRPGPGAGNCDQACWATILHLTLDEIPNFEEYESTQQRDDAKNAWFRKQGYFYLTAVEEASGGVDWSNAGLHVAVGKSPRGDWYHACVYDGNVLFHDPHPEGTGLLSVEFREFIIPLHPTLNAPASQGEAEARRLLRELSEAVFEQHKYEVGFRILPEGQALKAAERYLATPAPDEAVIREVEKNLHSLRDWDMMWGLLDSDEPTADATWAKQLFEECFTALRALLPDDKEGTNA